MTDDQLLGMIADLWIADTDDGSFRSFVGVLAKTGASVKPKPLPCCDPSKPILFYTYARPSDGCEGAEA